MKKHVFNIQNLVAAIFIAIFTMAALTTVFGQEKPDEKQKDRTKIVQLKVVEDENGTVKTIDTTFVFEGDEWIGDHSFRGNYFNMDELKLDSLLQSVKVWTDHEGFSYQFDDLDSLTFWVDVESMIGDSLDQSNILIKKLRSSLDELDEELKGQQFMYRFEGGGDSLHKYFFKGNAMRFDSTGIPHSGKYMFHNSDGEMIIFGNNKTIEIKGGGEGNSIVLKVDSDSDAIVDLSIDTTFMDGNQKVEIKTGTDGSEKYKIITVTSEGESSGEDETIIVEVEGDDYTIESSKDGSVRTIVARKLMVTTPAQEELDELKVAGVKTKKRQLDVENLSLSPNPSNGKFKLSFTLKEPGKTTVNIYRMNGDLVYTETLRDFQGTYNKEIDISDKGTGAFFLQIVQGLYDIIKKIIIQ